MATDTRLYDVAYDESAIRLAGALPCLRFTFEDLLPVIRIQAWPKNFSITVIAVELWRSALASQSWFVRKCRLPTIIPSPFPLSHWRESVQRSILHRLSRTGHVVTVYPRVCSSVVINARQCNVIHSTPLRTLPPERDASGLQPAISLEQHWSIPGRKERLWRNVRTWLSVGGGWLGRRDRCSTRWDTAGNGWYLQS